MNIQELIAHYEQELADAELRVEQCEFGTKQYFVAEAVAVCIEEFIEKLNDLTPPTSPLTVVK